MATCKDCICYSGCSGILNDFGMRLNPAREVCDRFEDRSQFVELPCKIGTELFRIKQINGKPFVTNTALNKNTFWKIVIKGEFGKTVFLTREEAKQALKGRENSV